MQKQAQVLAFDAQETPLADTDWHNLRVLLTTPGLKLDTPTLEALHRRLLTECRRQGERVPQAYLNIRGHLGAIFIPEHVDRALLTYIHVCEGTFVLPDAAARKLRLPQAGVLTGMAQAHELLCHPVERVRAHLFGTLHGWALGRRYLSLDRRGALACLSAFPTCGVVAELADALAARDRAFALRYGVEERLGILTPRDNVTPLFVCPVPDTEE
jgi:hypothetical protein